jgi:hypothetical protein
MWASQEEQVRISPTALLGQARLCWGLKARICLLVTRDFYTLVIIIIIIITAMVPGAKKKIKLNGVNLPADTER